MDFSKFPLPWKAFEEEGAFVRDSAGSDIAFVYFDREPTPVGRPTHDQARRIAENIAKLPELVAAHETAKAAMDAETNTMTEELARKYELR
jgi:hypothetical protein